MRDLVQVLNPKTDRYTLIDRAHGKILKQKRTAGPYAGVPIATREGVTLIPCPYSAKRPCSKVGRPCPFRGKCASRDREKTCRCTACRTCLK